MDIAGERILVAPSASAAALAAISMGVLFGTCSGHVPGLRVNSLALLLTAAAPSIPGSPLVVSVTLLAAGVTRLFLDIVATLVGLLPPQFGERRIHLMTLLLVLWALA